MYLPRPLQLIAGSVYVAAGTLFSVLGMFQLGVDPIPSLVAVTVAGIFGVVAIDAGRREFRDALFSDTVAHAHLTPSDARDVVAVVAAGPVTYVLSVSFGQGPVVASALVGLLAALTIAEQAPAAYCGSFVGMVSGTVFPTPVPVAAASLAAGAVYVLAKRVFGGFGGKLGTTAFVGCGVVVLPSGYTYAAASPFTPSMAASAVVAATVGAVVAFLLSVRLSHGAVVGSATVGLVAGLLAPPALGPELGGVVAAAAFAGSFVGMVSETRLPSVPLVGIAGVLSGLVFVGIAPYFGGSGGKLGTVAFTACLLTWAIHTVAAPNWLAG